jgi:hypothetical protein
MRGQAEFGLAGTILDKPLVLAVAVLGSIVIGAVSWFVASRMGAPRLASALSACGLALALAVTLGRPGVFDYTVALANPLQVCRHTPFSLAGAEGKLNFVMLMPFAFFGAFSTRRPVLIITVCAALSGGIEIFQALSGAGVCDTKDWLNNTIGGGLAAMAGWAATAVLRPARTAAI